MTLGLLRSGSHNGILCQLRFLKSSGSWKVSRVFFALFNSYSLSCEFYQVIDSSVVFSKA